MHQLFHVRTPLAGEAGTWQVFRQVFLWDDFDLSAWMDGHYSLWYTHLGVLPSGVRLRCTLRMAEQWKVCSGPPAIWPATRRPTGKEQGRLISERPIQRLWSAPGREFAPLLTNYQCKQVCLPVFPVQCTMLSVYVWLSRYVCSAQSLMFCTVFGGYKNELWHCQCWSIGALWSHQSLWRMSWLLWLNVYKNKSCTGSCSCVCTE